MRAEIVSIGTELLLGTITDTNASYLAQRLALLGIDCFYISQVGDNPGRLREVLGRAWERSDLTVATGGLGPTVDDLTREAIAEMLGETASLDAGLAQQVRSFFRKRGADMPERNLKQATLIPSAEAIPNPIGTAPGWWVSRDVAGSRRLIVAMPGVPFEMKRMWEQEVEPRLSALSDNLIASRTLKLLGIGESAAELAVVDLMAGSNPTLATYAKGDGVHLRITAKAHTGAEAAAMIERLEAQVRSRLGDAVYGADDDTPASVVCTLLGEVGVSLAVVEVGTGALGSVIPQLASCVYVAGTFAARDWRQASEALEIREVQAGAEGLRSIAEAACRKTGAGLALVVSCVLQADAGKAGTVRVGTEIIVGYHSGEAGTPIVRQRWQTAPSEAPRLVGLVALNTLRLALLHKRRGE